MVVVRAAAAAAWAAACQPMPVLGQGRIDLQIVYFSRWSTDIDADGASTLRMVAARMRAMPGARAVIYGYADTVGEVGANVRVAAARAIAVRDFIVSQGIAASRLELETSGESDGSSTTEGDRRVEISII